ncbi:hypothetical protein FD763_04475 [Klebsiella quasipneumoniae]|nr:hypothetical protein EHW95_18545 [Klebsiella quasipneumoniae]MBQ5273965.1 hypothetical protein [Klebsiella quasipneumoniae]SAM64953.1 hypothetical protein KQS06HV_40053 [Klebsiella quasipneumoniae subsp. similipneumoniae]HBW8873969.1 hypothetical protein [Klebsiella quasipneumoniae subsp. similipneumoniae]
MRQTPDEIVMLLELLDSRFKVNPWHGKSVFGPRRELANCADVCPFLPKILFWPCGSALGYVSFDNVLCIKGFAHDAPRARRQKIAI